MSKVTISAPSSASRSACERPCPRAPPLMKATFPSSRPMTDRPPEKRRGRAQTLSARTAAVTGAVGPSVRLEQAARPDRPDRADADGGEGEAGEAAVVE